MITVYSAATLQHARAPQHVGRLDPHDGLGRVRSTRWDDRLEISVRVTLDGAVRAAFRAQACPACIATASLLTQALHSAPHAPAAARAMTAESLAETLAPLPPGKLRCVALAPRALDAALVDAGLRLPATGPAAP